MIDEPLIVPISPGFALARLAQVIGGLARAGAPLQTVAPEASVNLEKCRKELGSALEAANPIAIAEALRDAQDQLLDLYREVSQSASTQPEETTTRLAALGFPPGTQEDLAAVDVTTVIPTYALRGRQVVTALSFDPAAGALGYWLYEVRDLRGEELEDPILKGVAPQFRRVRLAVGPHRLRIESHNSSGCRLSAYFDIDIPSLGKH